MILQIVLVLAALAALVYFVRRGQTVGIRAGKRLAFGGFVLVNIYAVLRPDDVTWVARALGIGRGTDLVVYLLVVAFVFGMLNSYLRDREISQHLTDLARQMAIRDAELSRREDELAARLAETAAVVRAEVPAAANGTHGGVAHVTGADRPATPPVASPPDRGTAPRAEQPAGE